MRVLLHQLPILLVEPGQVPGASGAAAGIQVTGEVDASRGDVLHVG